MSLVFATTFFFVLFCCFFLGGTWGGGVLRHSAVQTDFEFEISGSLVPDATYEVLLKLFHWFQGRKSLKSFLPYTLYGHGGHLSHVTSIMLLTLSFPCT